MQAEIAAIFLFQVDSSLPTVLGQMPTSEIFLLVTVFRESIGRKNRREGGIFFGVLVVPDSIFVAVGF